MSKSNRSKIEWPNVADVAAELAWVRDRCCDQPPARDEGDDDSADRSVWDDENDGYMDVRLQVYPNGQWCVRTGDACYDSDHRGYWGAGSLAWDTDCEDLAAGLIDEAKDHAAQGGEDTDDESEPDEEPMPDSEDIFTDDCLTFYWCRKPIVRVREGEDFWPALLAWCECQKYFPNVWQTGERGSYTLLLRDGDDE